MNPPPHSCFIADDLSGALEVGGLWHEQGHSVRLAINPTDNRGSIGDWITGFDLNTRQLTASEAYQAVHHCIVKLSTSGGSLLYKKIDSTLRGWILAEIRAILDAGWPGLIVLCPANPSAGRTIEDGRLLVDGIPVDQTAIGKDPAFPVTDARLSGLFEDGLASLHRHGALTTVRSTPADLENWVKQSAASGARILSFDAVTDIDLDAIARSTRTGLDGSLLCGSGALAAALGRQNSTENGPGLADSDGSPPRTDPGVAFLIGSAHPRTREQMDVLADSRALGIIRFDPTDPDGWAGTHLQIRRQSKANPVAIMPRTTNRGGDRAGMARAIQEFYRHWSRSDDASEFGRFFITGGETARNVMDGLGIDRLDLIGNLQPGVAITRSVGSTHPFTLVTKPGGYGNADTLVHCYDFLTL